MKSIVYRKKYYHNIEHNLPFDFSILHLNSILPLELAKSAVSANEVNDVTINFLNFLIFPYSNLLNLEFKVLPIIYNIHHRKPCNKSIN
jgi:hypothetical protein